MFTKLFSSITTSSIWNEDSGTRIVWITMLALANRQGYVAASVGGLAHEARVDREVCEKALKVLSSKDEDSRSKEFEGRRIDIVDGGFQLLNYEKYRSMRAEEDRREYMKTYMVEYRRTKNVSKNVNNVSECKPPLAAVNHSKPPLAKAEAEAEAEAAQTQKREKESLSPTREFTDLWKSQYLETLGKPYLFQGAKDGSAVARLLELGLPPARLLEIAKKAWRHNGWYCEKHSKTIATFTSQFNSIQNEVGELAVKPEDKKWI